MVPDGGAGGGGDVLNVEDAVLELFVEDAGLDLEGGLGGFEGFAEVDEAGGGVRSEVEGVDEAQHEGDGGDHGDDADEVNSAHAGGSHSGDFAVCGETGETEENADQDGHGDGDDEGVGQGVGDDAGDVSVGGRVADDELEYPAEVTGEDDEGKESSAEEGVRGDFAEDVAGEDTHFFYCFFLLPVMLVQVYPGG